jgi:hypothetical protein
MLVTESGKVNDVSAQFSNALSWMVVTEEPIVTDARRGQSAKV